MPAARFLAVVDRSLDLALVGESAARRICELRSGRQRFISLRVADQILARLDLEEWWHIPPELGGLSDIYVDGVNCGDPYGDRRKYATDEERLEARRASWRRSGRRQRTVA